MFTPQYHIPVLLHETIEGLNVQREGVYADLTFGGGGHSREILHRLGKGGRLYGFDQDEDASRQAPDDERFTFVHGNFRFLRNWMRYYGHEQLDGIMADLGVSSHHFDTAERGFSFRFDAPLDMRMNKRSSTTARTVVNEYSEEQLSSILRLYGELSTSRRLAAAIVEARKEHAIETTQELAELLKPVLGKENEKKEMAKVFQALRMEVNQEMKALKEMLLSTVGMLRPGGRLVVLTYHSLEDRMVKNMMKTGNVEGARKEDTYGWVEAPLRQVGKMTTPSPEEQQQNPRSRSAKLRVAEKTQPKAA